MNKYAIGIIIYILLVAVVLQFTGNGLNGNIKDIGIISAGAIPKAQPKLETVGQGTLKNLSYDINGNGANYINIPTSSVNIALVHYIANIHCTLDDKSYILENPSGASNNFKGYNKELGPTTIINNNDYYYVYKFDNNIIFSSQQMTLNGSDLGFVQ
jgi:hypothetical protein